MFLEFEHHSNMSKKRTPISVDVADEVMFRSDQTCCHCRERGKSVQIHHIDENRHNNTIDNLAVLCLDCHNNTQLRGGFGRHLSRGLVLKYRNDWLRRVNRRRNDADTFYEHGARYEHYLTDPARAIRLCRPLLKKMFAEKTALTLVK
jgi:hypothetical protein